MNPDLIHSSINASTAAWNGKREWQLAVPWGEWPNEVGLQVFTPDTCKAMVQSFNAAALSGRADDPERPGAPIFEGHPFAPQAKACGWTNCKRIGSVHELRLGDKGLECRMAWNADGERNAANRQHSFPSIGLNLRKDRTSGKMIPVEFDHIGMWEKPNIKAVPAWNAATNHPHQAPSTKNQEQDPMNKKLAALLGLTEDSTEADVEAAVNALKIKAAEAAGITAAVNAAVTAAEAPLQAACNAATQRAEAAETALAAATAETAKLASAVNAAHEVRNEAVLELAVYQGRISPADKPAYKTQLAADASKAIAAINALNVKYHRQPIAPNREQVQQLTRTKAEAEEKLITAVNAYMTEKKCEHAKAYNAVMADPANAALIKAANGDLN